jgi:hypothetical protein
MKKDSCCKFGYNLFFVCLFVGLAMGSASDIENCDIPFQMFLLVGAAIYAISCFNHFMVLACLALTNSNPDRIPSALPIL